MVRPCYNLEAAKHKKPFVGSSFYPSGRESICQDWDGRCHGDPLISFLSSSIIDVLLGSFLRGGEKYVGAPDIVKTCKSLSTAPLGAQLTCRKYWSLYGSSIPSWQVGLCLILCPQVSAVPELGYRQARRDILCVKEFGSCHEKQDESSKFHE